MQNKRMSPALAGGITQASSFDSLGIDRDVVMSLTLGSRKGLETGKCTTVVAIRFVRYS